MMRIPWISRASHETMLRMLTEEVGELKAERRILLDRLASMGLGGPLFEVAAAADAPAEEPEALVDPQQEIQEILRLRRRPSSAAQALTRKARREREGAGAAARTAWIPDVSKINAALDAAEAAGRQ